VGRAKAKALAKPAKKELSDKELESVAGGVVLTIGNPLADKQLTTAA
jgi:bacteriocin-like protein